MPNPSLASSTSQITGMLNHQASIAARNNVSRLVNQISNISQTLSDGGSILLKVILFINLAALVRAQTFTQGFIFNSTNYEVDTNNPNGNSLIQALPSNPCGKLEDGQGTHSELVSQRPHGFDFYREGEPQFTFEQCLIKFMSDFLHQEEVKEMDEGLGAFLITVVTLAVLVGGAFGIQKLRERAAANRARCNDSDLEDGFVPLLDASERREIRSGIR